MKVSQILRRAILLVAIATPPAWAQGPATTSYDTLAFAALKWREIGPFIGGRSVAVAGSASRPREYYLGTTGGGVMKTTDGGITWKAVTIGTPSCRFFAVRLISAMPPGEVARMAVAQRPDDPGIRRIQTAQQQRAGAGECNERQ